MILSIVLYIHGNTKYSSHERRSYQDNYSENGTRT